MTAAAFEWVQIPEPWTIYASVDSNVLHLCRILKSSYATLSNSYICMQHSPMTLWHNRTHVI